MLRSLLILLLFAVPAFGQAPAPPPVVVLPEQPVTPTPPAPKPAPDAPMVLTADSLYVARSQVECLVLASTTDANKTGNAIVKITCDAGPLKIRGKFVDGSGNVETRTFTEKYVWTVEAIGSGNVELIVVPVGAKVEGSIFRRMLAVNTAPQPPPEPPKPPEPPAPKPDPAPIPLAGFRVLIQYDPAALTLDQQGVVFGKQVRDYLQAKCVVGADGKTKEFRIYQPGLDVSGEAKWIGDVIQRHPGQKAWMVVSDGKTGYDGPLPANADEAMKILQKVGGQ